MGAVDFERLGKRFDLTPSRLIPDSASTVATDEPADEAEASEDEEEEVRAKPKDRWALKDITASVAPGERVAIVGANGAGKSTLLKIVAGRCLPTEGLVRGRGRVVSVNAMMQAFQSSATGVGNLRILARILRVERSILDERLPLIVAFSGLNEQVDKPVRTYSRGMYGRLAMAAVLHLDPDILLIDDGLSVGDVRFRHAVDEKLRTVLENGATLLFAGHKLSQLEDYCERALWLETGRLHEDGPVRDVLERYVTFMLERDRDLPVELPTEGLDGLEAAQPEPSLPDAAQDVAAEETGERRLVGPDEGRYGALTSFETCKGNGKASDEFTYLARIDCTLSLETYLPDVLVDLQIEIFANRTAANLPKATLIMMLLPDQAIRLTGAGEHSILTSVGAGLPPGSYTTRLRASFLDAAGAAKEIAVLVRKFDISGPADDDRLLRFQLRQVHKRRPLLRPRYRWEVQRVASPAPEETVY